MPLSRCVPPKHVWRQRLLHAHPPNSSMKASSDNSTPAPVPCFWCCSDRQNCCPLGAGNSRPKRTSTKPSLTFNTPPATRSKQTMLPCAQTRRPARLKCSLRTAQDYRVVSWRRRKQKPVAIPQPDPDDEERFSSTLKLGSGLIKKESKRSTKTH